MGRVLKTYWLQNNLSHLALLNTKCGQNKSSQKKLFYFDFLAHEGPFNTVQRNWLEM